MTEENKVPKLRFPEFTDDWEQRRLGDITDSYSGGTPKVGKSEYYNGEIPFIRSGEISSDHTELFITKEGLENSSAAMVNKGDILYALYGATSGEVNRSQITGAINQAILAILPHENFDSEFIMQWLRKNKASIISTYLQGGQGNLSGTIVKDLQIILPPYKEQVKIGQFLQSVDKLITLHQRKLETTQKLKQGFLQKLFPQNGKKIPELRFPEFSGDWEQRKLEDICEFSRGQGISWADIDDENGSQDCILYGNLYTDYDTVISKVTHKTNIQASVFSKKFDVLIPGSDTTPTGLARALCVVNEGVAIGGDINILHPKNDDGMFIAYALNHSKKELIKRIKGTTVRHLQNKDLLDIEISVPLIGEQKKISRFLLKIDKLITLHQRKLEIYQNIKKGLLQQMFV